MAQTLSKIFGIAALAVLAVPAWAQKDVVRSFYDWYLPIAHGPHEGPSWKNVMKLKGDMFSPAFATAVITDLEEAPAEKADKRIGLDFDPFFHSNEPCEKYQPGKESGSSSMVTVEMHAVCGGKREKKATLIVRLERQNKRWVIVDFDYPDGNSATGLMKKLRAERRATSSSVPFSIQR